MSDVMNKGNLTVQKIDLFRRKFLQASGIAGAAILGGGLLGTSHGADGAESPGAFGPKGHRHPISQDDILNFALNLEYLEAQFYSYATTGAGLAESNLTGVGSAGKDNNKQTTPGTVTVKANAQVPFAVPIIQQLASADLASDELNHVLDLRAVLGKKAVAMPNIDLLNSFTNAAIAAGVITSGETFDPFASDDNFLLGAFVFEDVGVTAYNGAAPYISNAKVLSYAASILAIEAYHAGSIRALLISRGQTTPTDISIANAISTLRAGADGSTPSGNESPLTNTSGNGNFDARNSNGLAYARTLQEVLNIVYLSPSGVPGGFFPNGTNGLIS